MPSDSPCVLGMKTKEERNKTPHGFRYEKDSSAQKIYKRIKA